MARTPEARTAGQRPLIAVVATVVLASGVQLQLSRGGDAGDGGTPTAGEQQPAEADASSVVGPPRGVAVADYVADRQRAMAAAPAGVEVAVVSFTSLRQPIDVERVLGDEVTLRALLVRLPLATAPPARIAVDGDPAQAVRSALNDVVGGYEEERRQTQSLLDDGSLTDEAFIADYEARVAELTAAIEAAGGGTAIVHAAVVEGPLAALQALEGRDGVRLVDPAPPGTEIATSVFHGLLPSDEDVTSVGRGG